MRLLFDQNLAQSLVRRLGDHFPDSGHLGQALLETATDAAVWIWARDHDYVLVTKDRDFEQAVEFPGPPPKCILIAVGNATTDDVEQLIRQSITD
ncbi:MAG: DUF5615 family PIN-like protein, partial [Chloroflexi bacterium]|nr:DUF5615 family PIN-like protein [Chloroflexota bacterium]